MYIYLNSDGCKKFFSGNSVTSFRTILGKTLHLKGKWEVAILDIDLPNFEAGYNTDFITVNTHICQESVFDDSLRPILLRVYKHELRRALRVTYPMYVPINTDTLASIGLYLKDSSDNEPSFSRGHLRCTLHLRQCRD